jgi:hypothetical protein
MALPDKHLDELIIHTLQAETRVSPAQQQAAWGALRARARQQIACAQPPQRTPQSALRDLWVCWLVLLADETRFERAASMHRQFYSSWLGVYYINTEKLARYAP